MKPSLPAHDPSQSVRLLGRIATVACSRIDATGLARTALDELVPALGADGGALYLLGEGELVLTARVGFPKDPPEHTARLPIAAQTAQLLAAGGVHQWTGATVGEQTRRVLDKSGARVVASAALTSAGARIGLVHLVRATEEPFDDDCLALLGIVAGQLGPALDAARRAGDDGSSRELSILQRNSMVIARQFDLSSVLDSCLALADELIGPDTVSIFIDDGTGEHFRLAAHHRHPRGEDALFESIPRARLAHFETDPRPQISRTRDLEEPYRSASQKAGLTDTLALPLIADGALVGILAMGFRAPHPIGSSTMNTLVALAEQQAAAIDRARIHHLAELRARLAETVRRVAERALAASSSRETTDAILDGFTEVTGGGGGVRLASLSDDGHLRTLGSRLLPSRLDEIVPTEATESSVVWMCGLPGPVNVTSVDELPIDSIFRSRYEHAQLRSLLILPLMRGNRLIGSLSSPSERPRHYQPEELHAMRLLASVAATALEADRLRCEAETERRHLGQVLEMLPVATSITDVEGRFIQLNAMVRRLDPKAHIGSTWRQSMVGIPVTRPDGTVVPVEEMPPARALREGRDVPPIELRIRGPSGWRSMMMQSTLLREDDGRIRAVLGTAQDVTALRELSDSKDRFLRMATHELRNPLTSLQAVTSRLAMDVEGAADPVRRRDFIARILRQVDRLARLIDDLYDVERLRDGTLALRPEPCDLGELVMETAELVKMEAKSLAPLRLDMDTAVAGKWDRVRIAQVITNLISNAFRYSPEGAEVAVGVKKRTDGCAELSVRDHGIGIPDAQKGMVFDAGFRGEQANRLVPGGAGLGLFITLEIVRRHGGRIEVESEPGRGSCFTVVLPPEPPPAPAR